MTELNLPAVLRCPVGGEEWPAPSFKSSCDTFPPKGKQSARTVHFLCPVGHLFSLGEAVRAGMLTRQHKKAIIEQAQAFWNAKLIPFTGRGKEAE